MEVAEIGVSDLKHAILLILPLKNQAAVTKKQGTNFTASIHSLKKQDENPLLALPFGDLTTTHMAFSGIKLFFLEIYSLHADMLPSNTQVFLLLSHPLMSLFVFVDSWKLPELQIVLDL